MPPPTAAPHTAHCPCGAAANAVLTARGSPTYPYRAIATCPRHEAEHTRWASTAGTVQRRALTAEPAETLF